MTIVCGICRAERVSWTAGEKLVCGVMNDWDEDGFILAAERMLARDAETCFGPWECEVRGDGARCGPRECEASLLNLSFCRPMGCLLGWGKYLVGREGAGSFL